MMDIPNESEFNLQLSDQSEKYRRSIATILAVMGMCMLFLIGAVIWLSVVVAGNTARNEMQIAANQAASDHRWCATMNLLTLHPVSKPADPASNPSREASYQLFIDFLTLKDGFGCDR